MNLLSLAEIAVLYAVPMILAITLHEAAHGYVARMFGDRTAEMMGRITLNPIKHIDPVGTIAVPLILFLVSKLAGGAPFFFGWAKPVPVNFGNLRHPKQDMFWVAFAGPLMNLLMAVGWAIIFKFAPDESGILAMAQLGVRVNVFLMVLNLLPIPPLDGGRIAVSILPHSLALAFARLEPYGMFIIILLVAIPGLLSAILLPLSDTVLGIISTVLGI
jgi:Zn-dependent protease